MDESVKRKIRKEIFRNLALLGQKKRLDGILSFEHPRGDATPCIQYENGTYYYVISERGREFSRKETSDLNELMFLVFEALTFSWPSDGKWNIVMKNEIAEGKYSQSRKN